ncbi:MAG: exodeoxyribonuclease VII small subunit [Bacteroidales bacterium]|nr:exodeoxyribonuclease VII small subunit [Bacteroidales bacterium]
MEKRDITYEQAMERLEELVEKMESPQATLQGLEREMKEAMELIRFCKEQLKGYQEEFDNILNEN